MTDSFPRGWDLDVAGGTTLVDIWVVVAEFAQYGTSLQFRMDDVDELIDQLAIWHPSGLCSPDRYALQLRIPASRPDQALEFALVYLREALESAALPEVTLVRVSVLSLEEIERSYREDEALDGTVTTMATGRAVPRSLYDSTRLLLAATTPDQIATTVDDFVAAIGAHRVEGACPRLPDTLYVRLDLGGPSDRYAVADAFSMAAVHMEHFLPKLLSDARFASERIRTSSQTPEMAHNTDAGSKRGADD